MPKLGFNAEEHHRRRVEALAKYHSRNIFILVCCLVFSLVVLQLAMPQALKRLFIAAAPATTRAQVTDTQVRGWLCDLAYRYHDGGGGAHADRLVWNMWRAYDPGYVPGREETSDDQSADGLVRCVFPNSVVVVYSELSPSTHMTMRQYEEAVAPSSTNKAVAWGLGATCALLIAWILWSARALRRLRQGGPNSEG